MTYAGTIELVTICNGVKPNENTKNVVMQTKYDSPSVDQSVSQGKDKKKIADIGVFFGWWG